MSYDFHLVPDKNTDDVLAEVHARFEHQEEEINPGPLIPEKEEWKNWLAGLLIKSNPNLRPFEFGFSAIARKYNWTEEEAHVRFRHIELNGPDDGNGIQITLYDESADITVPYWHQPEAAVVVFDEIWKYLTILADNGNLAVYDPQLDRILDLAKDQGEVVQRYGTVVEKVPDIIKTSSHQKRS